MPEVGGVAFFGLVRRIPDVRANRMGLSCPDRLGFRRPGQERGLWLWHRGIGLALDSARDLALPLEKPGFGLALFPWET